MKGFDLKQLIEDRMTVVNAIGVLRSRNLPAEIKNQLSTISMFTGEHKTWEFIVSCAGYLDHLGEESALSVNQIIDKINEDRARAANYFDNVLNIPITTVLLGGTAAAQRIDPDLKLKIIPTVSSVDYCTSKCGKDPKCLAECIENYSQQREYEREAAEYS